jgi:hypothetical protein
MSPLCPFMEIAMIRSIEHVQSIQDILASMGMYNVEENGDA